MRSETSDLGGEGALSSAVAVGNSTESLREQFFEAHKFRNYAAFWMLGMINNFHYCLVLSASSDIAESYNLKQYVAMISWANVIGGIFVRLLNAFVFPSMPYKLRFLIAGLQTILGVVVVSTASHWGSDNTFRFVISLLGVMFVGNGSSWGESVALGYMERFPSNMVGGWSSGTGMSGVLAALIFMGLTALGVSNSIIFLVSLFLVCVFWASFYFLLVTPLDAEMNTPVNNWNALSWRASEPNASGQRHPARSETASLLSEGAVQGNDLKANEAESHVEHKAGLRHCFAFFRSDKFKEGLRLHNRILFNNVNLALVYVFEYAAQFVAPFCFPCAMTKSSGYFVLKNSFVITQLCYQVGVLISRSSLSCFRISRVEILTIIQLINSVGWFVQSKLMFIGDESDEEKEMKLSFILFSWMIFVGLLGGASYVNVFYNLLELTKNKFEDEEDEPSSSVLQERRQLCMNIGSLYAIGGITVGCFVDVIFANTVLTDQC